MCLHYTFYLLCLTYERRVVANRNHYSATFRIQKTMKRKLKLSTVFKSTWWRFFDAMLRSPPEFYPPEQKRIFFTNSTTYRSISLRNGQLYGGCLEVPCPRKCVPMKEFVPVTNRDFWLCALEAHNAAVNALDLDVATEQRVIIDSERHFKCLQCRGQDEMREELFEPRVSRFPPGHSNGRANGYANDCVHEEAQEDAQENAQEEAQEEVQKEAQEDAQKDAQEDAQEEALEEVQEEVQEDAQEDTTPDKVDEKDYGNIYSLNNGTSI